MRLDKPLKFPRILAGLEKYRIIMQEGVDPGKDFHLLWDTNRLMPGDRQPILLSAPSPGRLNTFFRKGTVSTAQMRRLYEFTCEELRG